MASADKWYFRSGELSRAGWDVLLDPQNPPVAGWKYTGLRVGTLTQGASLALPADSNERIIFLLEGEEVLVEYLHQGESASQVLRGRPSVFHGPSDYIYLPIHTSATITGTGRIAVGETPATKVKTVRYVAKSDVSISLRGAGRETRQVHNLGMPETLDADRMIVCEVIVPAGNWSGAPSHKHDTYIPGRESNLEEIYYFESAVTRGARHQLLHHLLDISADHLQIAVPTMSMKRFSQAMWHLFPTVGMDRLLLDLDMTSTSLM